MKKRFLIILGIVMVLGFVGCGKKAVSEGFSEETTIEIEDTETAVELEVISKDSETSKTNDNKSGSKSIDNNQNKAYDNAQGLESNTDKTINGNAANVNNGSYAVSDCSVDNSYTESNNAPVSNSRVYYPESYINYMNNPNSSSGSSNSTSTSAHIHNYSEPVYETQNVLISEAWDEPIGETAYKCKHCLSIILEKNWHQHEEETGHTCWITYPESILVGYTHHDAVYENQQVVIGYKCPCGDIWYV